jgi:hypothetical protein
VIRIVILAVFIASGLYGLRESGVLDRAGLLGSCETVQTAATVEGEWLGCQGGRLSGAPDLSNDSCRKGATRDGVTYWYCPEKLVAGNSSDESTSP